MFQGGYPDPGSGATYDPGTGAYVTPNQRMTLTLGKVVPIGAAILGALALSKGQTLAGLVGLGGAYLMWKGV